MSEELWHGLTKDEIAGLEKLGRNSEYEFILNDVFQGLIDKGIVYLRSEKQFDLTDYGEQLYIMLTGESD